MAVTAVKPTGRSQWIRRPIIILVVTLVLALALEAGFYLGQHAAFSSMGADPETYRAMQAELVAVEQALRSREAELEVERTRREVDRQALELVRKDMAGQNEEIAALEEGVAFYRSLMSPGDLVPGLSVRSIELMAAEQAREYVFRIVLQQESRKHALLKGSLSAWVSGEIEGEPIDFSLGELSEDFEGEGIPLQFRYFQSFEGRLLLPEGFEPREVSVHARTREPQNLEIREQYPWQLEERFSHVGK